MRDLLYDTKANDRLNREGFVVLPFLTGSKLDELREGYDRLHPNGPEWYKEEGIHMTSWVGDLNYKLAVEKHLRNAFDDRATESFDATRTVNHVFIVKQPGKHTTFNVHQDWSVVDETRFRSVNVWVPLQDVEASTGALWVIPGSHKNNRKVRGSGYLFPNYSAFLSQLQPKAQSISMKAGEALVFFHNTIHGSPPNLGDSNRVVACFSVLPCEAPLHIFFQPGPDKSLEVHHPDDDFLYHYKDLRTETIIRPPTESPSAQFDSFQNKPIVQEEIDQLLATAEKLI